MLVRLALICTWRRLRPFLIANPLLAAIATLAVPALPVLAIVGGERIAPALSEAILEQEGIAEALVAVIAFSGALAGLVAVAAAPGVAAFGPQILASPAHRWRLIWAGSGLPLALAATAISGLLALAALPVTARLPDGRYLALEIGFAALCAGALGALLIESTLATARARPEGILSLCSLAALWILSASVSGSRALGPLVVVSSSIDSSAREISLVTAGLGALALVAALSWLHLAGRRPSGQARTEPRPLLRGIPRAPFGAGAVVAAKRLWRHPDLRREILPISAFSFVAGPAILIFAPRVPRLLALGIVSYVEMIAVTLFALAAAGVDAEGGWLWSTAPLGAARSRAAGNALGAILLALATCLVALSPSLALARPPFPVMVEFAGFACFVLGVAVASGAIVSWRPNRTFEQIASYTALAVLAGLLLYLAGKIAAPLTSAGAPEPVVLVVMGIMTVAGGIGANSLLCKERSP